MLTALFIVLTMDAFRVSPDKTTLTMAASSAALAWLIAAGSMLLVAMTVFSATLILRHPLHRGPVVPNPGYIAAALAVAVANTVTLRAVPFAMKNAMKQSALLADIGRWMPLGAITILAAYCLSNINLTTPTHGIPELTGIAVTVAIHWWRRNAVFSIVTGTVACLVLPRDDQLSRSRLTKHLADRDQAGALAQQLASEGVPRSARPWSPTCPAAGIPRAPAICSRPAGPADPSGRTWLVMSSSGPAIKPANHGWDRTERVVASRRNNTGRTLHMLSLGAESSAASASGSHAFRRGERVTISGLPSDALSNTERTWIVRPESNCPPRLHTGLPAAG